ncbi:hypothetical protein BHM03_00036748 [Ensete ventricosum]|nr:hypothetical protein BHM03_00036748 [Ensete ventricosum]
MKLVRRDLLPNGPGGVKVCSFKWNLDFTSNFRSLLLGLRRLQIIPEEDDDMWHAYNLISAGDTVKAATVR